jgi:hypothetical protein
MGDLDEEETIGVGCAVAAHQPGDQLACLGLVPEESLVGLHADKSPAETHCLGAWKSRLGRRELGRQKRWGETEPSSRRRRTPGVEGVAGMEQAQRGLTLFSACSTFSGVKG